MSFREQLNADLKGVFLNDAEFADRRTVEYDGKTYKDVAAVMSGLQEKERRQLVTTGDRAEGLYLVEAMFYCDIDDLDGNQPEKGMRIAISDADGSGFMRQFRVASSTCELGMLRLELEAIDE